MRFSIDLVFLNGDLQVIGVTEGLRPWRIAGKRGARVVLELGEGEVVARRIRVGERLIPVRTASARAVGS